MPRHAQIPGFLGGTPAQHHGSILSRIASAAEEWSIRRRTASMLGSLNDRLLDDIGLTRADIAGTGGHRNLR